MAFEGAKKDEVLYLQIPDWVKEEPTKLQSKIIAYLFQWRMFGMGEAAKESLFNYIRNTDSDLTDYEIYYIIRRMVEEGAIKAVEKEDKL